MTFRRTLIVAGILLIVFLGVFSWNQATHLLDDIGTEVGLEAGGGFLRSMRAVQDSAASLWNRYFDLVGVRGENEQLKARIVQLEASLSAYAEDLAELKRLRRLIQLPVDASWRPLGARVLAGRIGPNAVLESITISRGYATGGRPGTPLVTHMGLVGRVYKASAHSSSVLLVSDPASRISVFTQQGRAKGILMGHGTGKDLELDFVPRGVEVAIGELIVTSGLDGTYPKGIPVARVISVAPSNYTEFQAIRAEPLVDLQHLEEVLLLEPTGVSTVDEEPEGPPSVFVGPPKPGSSIAP